MNKQKCVLELVLSRVIKPRRTSCVVMKALAAVAIIAVVFTAVLLLFSLFSLLMSFS